MASSDGDKRNTINTQQPVASNDQKVFCSRVPVHFTEESIKRLFEEKLGVGTVLHVALTYETKKEETVHQNKEPSKENDDEQFDRFGRPKKGSKRKETNIDHFQENKPVEKEQHLGYGFVTFISTELASQAAALQTIRGKAKLESPRKYTFYVRPCHGDDEKDSKKSKHDKNTVSSSSTSDTNNNICFLWAQFRCPYSENCKFEHVGEGGTIEIKTKVCLSAEEARKRIKCFNFRKGKCKLTSETCPYSHDFIPPVKKSVENIESKNGGSGGDDDPVVVKREPSEKDCLSWKKKGKCSKGTLCPYRHLLSLQTLALEKKSNRKRKLVSGNGEMIDKKQQPAGNEKVVDKIQQMDSNEDIDSEIMKSKKQKLFKRHEKANNKEKRPLSVRVFGMNYETTESDIREFLQDCGKITNVIFPVYEDSGRSKGYCGVYFQSPNATDMAVTTKDGKELNGRWLRIQAGKMLLDEWEKPKE